MVLLNPLCDETSFEATSSDNRRRISSVRSPTHNKYTHVNIFWPPADHVIKLCWSFLVFLFKVSATKNNITASNQTQLPRCLLWPAAIQLIQLQFTTCVSWFLP